MSDPGKAVFLSYASQDAEAAKRICDTLRSAGVEVWFDAEGGLEHGDEWDAKIRRQIKECVLFLPIISANTQAREEGYFRIEWDLAAERARGIASGVAFILPVIIDGTTEPDALVPDRFRKVQWTKLPGGEVPPEVLQRFLKLWSHRTGVLKNESRQLRAESGESVAVVAALRRDGSEKSWPKAPPTGRALRWLAPVAAIAVLVAAGLGTVFWRYVQHNSAVRRLHEVTGPEIQRLAAAQDIAGAFALAEQAERELPGDAVLEKLWPTLAVRTTIETTPAGAEVYAKPYMQPQTEWRHIGRAPLKDVRLPRAYTRWKIELPGSAPFEAATAAAEVRKFTLEAANAVPPDMVPVPGSTLDEASTGFPSVTLGEFLIDRHEVTNRQFKEFVDRDGYAEARYWAQPFVKAGRTLAREEAMAQFHDSTGRPGPADWKNGTFPEAAADLPVTGVSWFEAAAYAEWAGKRLPSVYHWRAASRVSSNESSVPLSNFAGKGLARVGTYQGLSAAGAYDMAGNAKEWCANAAGPDTRYILGGSWREPDYMFAQADALSPFDRGDGNGFRCMRARSPDPSAATVAATIPPVGRDFASEQPVNDETFRVFRGLYAYDKGPLEVHAEGSDDSDPRWRKEKVSYRAAYGDERITAFLFLPKNATPPYQAIVWFPGAGSIAAESSDTLRDLGSVAMLVGSGRVVIYPVYKGTYERRAGYSLDIFARGGTAHRDWVILLAKDFCRTLDYLETRPDIQAGKMAYAGQSWGGGMGLILPALDSRIKVSVLLIGGYFGLKSLPEVDQLNFAPRNTVPTLMLNGRFDFRFQLETQQRTAFRALGAPAEQKRHVLYDCGHSLKPEQIAGEAYTWLDRYLGVVK